ACRSTCIASPCLSPVSVRCRVLAPGLRGHLGADSLLLLPDLPARVAGGEILGLEHLAQLDLGPAVERRPLEPFDRLVLRLHLPEPEAGDQLLRLAEGPVGDGALRPFEL